MTNEASEESGSAEVFVELFLGNVRNCLHDVVQNVVDDFAESLFRRLLAVWGKKD